MNRKERQKLPDDFPYEDELAGCRGIMVGVGITLLVGLLLFCLTGCGSTPYAQVGAGYDWEKQDFKARIPHPIIPGAHAVYPVELDCVVGQVEAGLEWDRGWSVGAFHQSCIEPHRVPEKEVNAVLIKKKWGGK